MVLKEELKPYKVEKDGNGGAIEIECHGSALLSSRERINFCVFLGNFDAKGGSVQKVE